MVVHEASAQCVPSVAPGAPQYPADSGFDTADLVSMAAASEVVSLRYTPNSPPDNWDAQDACPHDEAGLSAWEDSATWTSGSVPGDGEDIVLPENTRVIVGGCSLTAGDVFGIITVPETSELIFADEDISLGARGILVLGKLVMGSETCRLSSSITITLHGERPTTLPAAPEYKGLVAQGNGVLDIHGAIYHPTWTRLASTANASDTTIYLQHRVNWQVGQQVVLTGTEIKDARDWHRNEVRTITNVAVSGEFSSVTLDTALEYTHYGGPEYQGEVGLLTRNIVIQGDPSSEPTDDDMTPCYDEMLGEYPCEGRFLTGYGGHTIAMGENAAARFEGVQLYRMGQTNQLARYPFHLHLMGESGSESYLKHSSIYHSFYRCATIHGTNNTLLQDNVAYDAIGQCYYTGEDGVEENNTIAYNLGAHVHFMESPRTAFAQFMDDVSSSEDLTQPADTTASGLYITNCANRYVGNAMSGGYAGIAIVKLERPIMNFRNVDPAPNLAPHERPFLEFDGNSCHSSGFWWVMASCIYVGGLLGHQDDVSDALVYNPGRQIFGRSTMCLAEPEDGMETDRYVECPLEFNNTKVFLSNWGLNMWGQRSTIRGLEAHDTTRALAILGIHFVTNMLTVCKTGVFLPENPSPTSHWFAARWFGDHVGFEWYDTAQMHEIDGLTFRNCGMGGSPVWRFLTHSDRYVPGVLQATRNIRYESVNRSNLVRPSVDEYLSVSGYLASWYDYDGTVFRESGIPDASAPKLIGAAREGIEWWRIDDTCELITDLGGEWYTCDRISPETGKLRGVASITIDHNPIIREAFDSDQVCGNGETPRKDCPRIGSVTHLGQEGSPDEVGLPLSVNTVVTGPTDGPGWLIQFDAGSPVQANFTFMQIDEADIVMVALPYPVGTSFEIFYDAAYWCYEEWSTCRHEFTAAGSVDEVRQGNGDLYYYDSSSELLHLRLVQQRMESLDFSEPPADGVLGTTYFENNGMRIPPIMWGGQVTLLANGCELSSSDSHYCMKVDMNNGANNADFPVAAVAGAAAAAAVVILVAGVILVKRRPGLLPSALEIPNVPSEVMWPGQRMSLEVKEILHEGRSRLQDVLVFQSATYGKVLVLDGVIQLTERDEFSYQEMITHLPLFAHPNPRRVLLIGGGDGGVVRELCRHACLEEIVMCEIDEQVPELSKKFLGDTIATGFNDPRVTLLHEDGAKFLETTKKVFDVIIVDSSDPVGPAETLYEADFFEKARNRLDPEDGIFINLGECMWLHLPLIKDMMQRCGTLFPTVNYSYATVPTYPSGQIGFVMCSRNPAAQLSVPSRSCELQGLRYYSEEAHRAAFVLPKFAEDVIGPARKQASVARHQVSVHVNGAATLAALGALALGFIAYRVASSSSR
ncbi:Spermidine synthase [Hondaea fermentalgiana]|uniref:Spermidine synthase n=1 Tax=Hondaea fermentalgiana TaxID=2315210 RepID=A0A2R5G1V5_9STRA|nr:Spermidine synthase [Hondaea fermentalgiana]|eukprot:GBG25007.1 Spermidine synthase [Hondaea fermentalgiana]